MEGALDKKDVDKYIKYAIEHGRGVVFFPLCDPDQAEKWKNTEDENKSYSVIINPPMNNNPFGI